ncbi:hypothetical protein [Maliponia aquimaris]|uniref:Uncharacterized protein n=1 Tax=Maliponia aquimaris TaxID=1673631 RepID=A0A238KH74_9RHOB|nr:hypothetical protein [Maliponia aquimaris]SMX41944.1 hypothetical protein MAA8898_02491 [Maliponia aquimaris]
MTARLRRSRPQERVPVLAMVDAFVGGTAILLILIILASNQQETQGTQPQADLVMRCAGGLVTITPPPWTDPPPAEAQEPEAAADWAALHPRPDRLLLNIRLEADAREYRCATRFQRAADQMNDLTDDTAARDTTAARAILTVTLVLSPPPADTEPRP